MDKLDQFFLEDLEGELFLDVLTEDTTLDLLIDDTHRSDLSVDPASDDHTSSYLDDVDDENLDRVIYGDDDDDFDDDYDDFY